MRLSAAAQSSNASARPRGCCSRHQLPHRAIAHGIASRQRQRVSRVGAAADASGQQPGEEQQQQPQQQQDVKRAAAEAVVRQHITSNSTVAFGNGELVNRAIAHLGDCLLNKELENVRVVAASSTAAHEAAFFGVPNISLEEAGGKVSLLVDQVDQFDETSASLAALKGIRAEPQQPELPRLRQMLAAADKVVLLVEGQDVVSRLGGSLPVFIEAGGEDNEWEAAAEALDDLFLGDAEVWRRPTSGSANPRGGKDPYVSPGGCNILDVRFYEGLKLVGEDAPYESIASEIQQIEGVVAHGLLLGVADAVVVADGARGVRTQERPAGQADFMQQAAATVAAGES